ncbi:MAG: (2Fe-2S) ferredoxin domain-containing protein [Treponemataceae bacterium]|nr:(2Fe-2S) ferredoxin domain-containing protein [Treponemataceae bacterium]
MAKLSLEELRAIRANGKTEMAKRETEGKTAQIIIGMGTAGIAAGAKDTLDAFIKAVDEAGLGATTIVRQIASLNKPGTEPTVEVIADGAKTLYGSVTPDVAKQIVAEHLVGKKAVEKSVIGR